ncbi:uncharacterized protein LOC135479482 [Liolophura sinensis]|uniref:uncharacterized protein LOC135479482 n=1 Tax=Liolophura sinensis TaxID=3198878 RepID=UPI0031589516
MNVSSQDKETRRQLRERGRKRIFKMGIIQLGFGLISFVVGILSLVFGVPTGSFPFVLGVGLWVGVLVLLAGLFGFQAGRQTDTVNGEPSGVDKCYVICHYVFSLISALISPMMPVFGGLGIHYCLNPGSVITVGGRSQPRRNVVIYCDPNHDANLALSGVTLAIGIIIFFISIPFTTYFCCYAKAYGFKSRRDQEREMMQMRQEISILQKQVADNDNQSQRC